MFCLLSLLVIWANTHIHPEVDYAESELSWSLISPPHLFFPSCSFPSSYFSAPIISSRGQNQEENVGRVELSIVLIIIHQEGGWKNVQSFSSLCNWIKNWLFWSFDSAHLYHWVNAICNSDLYNVIFHLIKIIFLCGFEGRITHLSS